MKKPMILMVGMASLLLAGAVNSQSGADIARTKNCMVCHEVDKKKVGPSFKDSAAKYKGNKDAESKLIGELKEGKGHPVKISASDAELKTVIQYVLTQQ